jgi:predicted transcriptional regulator
MALDHRILKNWATLNGVLTSLGEDECYELLTVERSGKNRRAIVERIEKRRRNIRRIAAREARADAMAKMRSQGMTCQAIATDFGVSRFLVWRELNR